MYPSPAGANQMRLAGFDQSSLLKKQGPAGVGQHEDRAGP
jgi:hypothetical protein